MVAEELDTVWRENWGRLLAVLTAQYRRLDLAEDALAEAFEAAARRWPVDGLPANPPAWLLTAARRRAIDRLRAEAVAARRFPLLVVDAEVAQLAARVMADPGELVLHDERARLVFLCAHPALAPEAASALTLRMVMGLSTPQIARCFLVGETAMAARLTRARTKLAAAGVRFAVPGPVQLAERLDVVATVAYLAFTAGYVPGAGADLLRIDLAGEAVRLVRVLRAVLPGRPVLDALLALMLVQHARRDARVDAHGRLVMLADQDRRLWRDDEIAEALVLLTPLIDPRQNGLGHNGPVLSHRARDYLLQALIAAEHARAVRAEQTDWQRIAQLYGELEQHTGSVVVRLNRAVAVAEAAGPAQGLLLLEGLDARLPRSHRLPAVRAQLLARQGRRAEALADFDQALALCDNHAERTHLATLRDSVRRKMPH